MSERRTLRLRLLAVVAGVAAVGAACSSSPLSDDDDGRSARVGESFVAGLSAEIEGFPSTIVVPGRRYDLLVTSPREEVDTITADEAGIDPDAAGGTRFVAVTWRLGVAGGDSGVLGGDGPDVSPQLSLVVDGESISVAALDEEGVSARWVVVPEDARRIGVAVEYDGVTQTIPNAELRIDRPDGGPELLYADPPGLHRPACPEPPDDPEPASYILGGCNVTIGDPFPYHEELGWADDGQAWVVAELSVDSIVVGWDEPGTGGAASYETAPEDVEVTLDGAGPVDILTTAADRPAGLQDDGDWSGRAVFSVPADVESYDVAFRRPFTGLPEDPDAAEAVGGPAELAGTYEAMFPIAVG